MKINLAGGVAMAAILIGLGFLAGYLVAKRESPVERLAQQVMDENQRMKPVIDKQNSDAEKLQRAYLRKIDRDLRKISDEGREKPKNDDAE